MSSLTAKKQPQQQHDGEGGGRRGLKRQKREASSSSSSSESDSSASRRRRHQQQGVSNNNNELLQQQQQQSEAKAAGSVTPNKNVMSNNNLQVVTESAAKPIAEAGLCQWIKQASVDFFSPSSLDSPFDAGADSLFCNPTRAWVVTREPAEEEAGTDTPRYKWSRSSSIAKGRRQDEECAMAIINRGHEPLSIHKENL